MSDITKDISAALGVQFDASEQQALTSAISKAAVSSDIARFGAPNLALYIPGNYYSNHYTARISLGQYTGSTGVMDLVPFVATAKLDLSEIGCPVAIGTASTSFQVLIYDDSGPYGFPGSLVYKSTTLSATTTGWSGVACNIVLEPNRIYWIGVQSDGAPILGGRLSQECYSFGAMSNTGGDAHLVRKTTTFGAAPNNWMFTSADLASTGQSPVVRFRLRP